MSEPAPRVITEIDGDIAIVRLNRPEKHNGVDFAMLDALRAAARQLRRDRRVRVAILLGEGPSFCAGIDVKAMFASGSMKSAVAVFSLLKPWSNRFQKFGLDWRRLPVPVIAVVHGNCFGAGLQLALAADIRIAHPDAKFSVMEAKWGLIPDMSGMLTLRDHLPRDVAFELTATGRIVDAAEARALGLVTHVDADPLAAARRIAAEIATRSPDASAAAKHLFRQGWSASEWYVLLAERLWQLRMMLGKNQRIAIARNMGKPELPYRPRSY